MGKTFISMLQEFANQPFWRIFFIVALMNFISTVIYNHFVWSDLIYINESGLNSNDVVFQKGSESRMNLNLLIEFFSPFWLFIKLGLAACLIYLVAYIFRINGSLNEFFKIVLISYLFVVFGDLIYSVILLFYNPPSFKADVLHYFPLSVLNSLDNNSYLLEYYFIWARLNVFQLFFILVLFLLLRSYLAIGIKESIILTSAYVLFYGLFLILWLFVSN